MNTRIQELTDIIYNEGVVKGQEEADRILAEANEKAGRFWQKHVRMPTRFLQMPEKRVPQMLKMSARNSNSMLHRQSVPLSPKSPL